MYTLIRGKDQAHLEGLQDMWPNGGETLDYKLLKLEGLKVRVCFDYNRERASSELLGPLTKE